MSFEPRQTSDLTRGYKAVFLWLLPVVALIAASSWPRMRPWLWIPALIIMGVGCVTKAARCGRLHCYVTGPMFLTAAAYVMFAEFHLVPMRPDIFLEIVVCLTAFACVTELVFGRYI